MWNLKRIEEERILLEGGEAAALWLPRISKIEKGDEGTLIHSISLVVHLLNGGHTPFVYHYASPTVIQPMLPSATSSRPQRYSMVDLRKKLERAKRQEAHFHWKWKVSSYRIKDFNSINFYGSGFRHGSGFQHTKHTWISLPFPLAQFQQTKHDSSVI